MNSKTDLPENEFNSPSKLGESTDQLFEIFETLLFEFGICDESHDEFIDRVTDRYMSHLTRDGYVPFHLIECVRQDILLDVKQMVRARTYGYYDLAEYRKSLDLKN